MAECPGGSHFSSLSLSSFICNVGLCEQRGLDRMASYCFRLKVKPRISRACSRAPAKSWWLAALGARGLRGLMLPFASRQGQAEPGGFPAPGPSCWLLKHAQWVTASCVTPVPFAPNAFAPDVHMVPTGLLSGSCSNATSTRPCLPFYLLSTGHSTSPLSALFPFTVLVATCSLSLAALIRIPAS